MIEAVIFDMDGVIIESEQVYKNATNVLTEKLGFIVEDALFSSFTGRRSKECWQIIIDAQKQKFDYNSAELAERKEEIFLSMFYDKKQAVLVDGVHSLMKKFVDKGIPLMIASSSPIKSIQMMLDYFHLNDLFVGYVSGDQVIHGKPEPDIFLAAANNLGIEPRKCLVIEDSDAGVLAAKRAGMSVIGFANPNSHNQELSNADLIVENYEEDWELIQSYMGVK